MWNVQSCVSSVSSCQTAEVWTEDTGPAAQCPMCPCSSIGFWVTWVSHCWRFWYGWYQDAFALRTFGRWPGFGSLELTYCKSWDLAGRGRSQEMCTGKSPPSGSCFSLYFQPPWPDQLSWPMPFCPALSSWALLTEDQTWAKKTCPPLSCECQALLLREEKVTNTVLFHIMQTGLLK